ncbi:MAG: Ig-like domain-containing protein [bacterium]
MRHNIMHHRRSLTAATAAAAFLLAGCSDQATTSRSLAPTSASRVTAAVAGPAVSVTLTATAATLTVGQTITATALVKDANGVVVPNTVIWRSGNTKLATVVSAGQTTGTLTGLAPGSVTIMAGLSDKMYTTLVVPVVVPAPTPVVVGATPPTTLGSPTTLAALPRATVPTAYPTMTRQVHVLAGANLQVAINAAQPGDELLLAPGATFVGNFMLPDKGASTSWIVIRTDLPDASIGAAGTRMTPSRAGSARLAKVLSPSYSPAIGTAPSAHYYRLTGLEIGTTAAAQTTGMNVLVRFGDAASNGQRTLASVPHHLVIDRSYLHGTSTLNLKRCVTFNSAWTAAVDSWISECHDHGSDSQAILGYNGPGPFAILNNHLEAGHEIVMWGGSDPAMQAMTPSDITLRGNYITRPISWKGVWQTKNILETKNVHHYLVEGNVMDGVWADAQAGFAIVMKSENQDNTAPYSQTADVTIRLNRIRNAGSGFNFSGKGSSPSPNVAAARITVVDNVIDGLNEGAYAGDGVALQVLSSMQDLYFGHNTVINAHGRQSSVVFDGAPSPRLTMHSNVFGQAQYGLKGAGGNNLTTLPKYAPGALFAANAFVGGNCSGYATGTFCPASWTAVGFQSYTGRDYQIVAGTTLAGKGYVSGDVGSDVAAVNAATAGVVVAP